MTLSTRARAPSHAPDKHAVWTLASLSEEFDRFNCEVYPNTPHEGVMGMPGELFARSLATQGERPARFIADDENFRTMTMRLHPRQVTIHYNKGLRVDYFWYWNTEFSQPKWKGQKVTVRVDPQDVSYVMAQLGTTWVKCECRSTIVSGCTRNDIAAFAEECRAEAKLTNSNKRLAPHVLEKFIARIRAQEIDLERAKKDRQAPVEKPPISRGKVVGIDRKPHPPNIKESEFTSVETVNL